MIRLSRKLALAALAAAPLTAFASAELELADFVAPHAGCHNRAGSPQTAVVDTHIHFRPFGGPAHAFGDVVSFMERTGVRFANVYGIGQMLPLDSPCTYYLDCPGVPVTPTLKNDFANVLSLLANPPENAHLTLSMTFFDLERPDQVLEGIALLDEEFPGLFRWAGGGQSGQTGAVRQQPPGGSLAGDRALGAFHVAAARTRHPVRRAFGPGQRY